MSFRDRLVHAYNILTSQNDPIGVDYGSMSGRAPDRPRLRMNNERSIVAGIYTRIGIDCSSIDIRHVRLDEQRRYLEDIDSKLNDCLTVEANIDQSGRDLLLSAYIACMDEGVVGIVPVSMSADPRLPGSWEIEDLRVCSIVQFMPNHVRIDVYNDQTGRHEQKVVEKKYIAIIHNPFYLVMNEPNSILQRIIRKLNLLDTIDEKTASTKLDLIIQLPFTVRSETLRKRAQQRVTDIETQLMTNKFGIAYSDGSEKITQLNRPVENTIMPQVEYLMGLLYSQLGVTKGVMDGTAEEAEMLNYVNRTVEPFVRAFAEEFIRKFLTKTARTQRQWVKYFRDPFKLVPMKDLAEMADKFTRNEIVTSNEFRGFIGLRPVADPRADELRNSNMPQSELGMGQPAEVVEGEVVDAEIVEEGDPIAEMTAEVDRILAKLEA